MNKIISSEITHKRVLFLAFPVVLSNATIPILGAVDTAVVGQMGLATPIGAVGIAAVTSLVPQSSLRTQPTP